jgi:hypothetical protein
MSVVQTGVFASMEQLAQVRKAFHEARETPVMRVHGVWMHEEALESAKSLVDKLAVECGLPPPGLIEGQVNHYGLLPTGEFNRYELDAP